MKEGLTYISKRTSQLRYADSQGKVQWVNPVSEYKAAVAIKRGQPVSIADSEDLAGTDFATDTEAYVTLANSVKHESIIGLALNFANAGEDVKVLSNGKFTFDTTKSTELEYNPSITYSESAGKIIYVGQAPGSLTISRDEALASYKNILQVGYVADAPSSLGSETEHEVVIEVQPTGDTRGPIDHTQFELKLGEDVYITPEDPMRIFAVGDETASKFEFYTGLTNELTKLKTSDFIALQKQSGKTAFIRFNSAFDIADIATNSSIDDVAFIKVAQCYSDDLEIIDVTPSDDVEVFTNNLITAFGSAFSYIADEEVLINDTPVYTTRELSGSTVKVSSLTRFIATNVGGYYDVYVSENAKNTLFSSSYVKSRGSFSNKGLAVIADMRNTKRQNVIGAYYGSVKEGLLTKGESILVIKQGEFSTTSDFFTPGTTYYLGDNGRLTTGELEIYDSVVKVGVATAADKMVIDMNDSRLYNNGDLPVGYIKPSVKNEAEFGFCLMDGETSYYTDDEVYITLYKRLTGWFSDSELQLAPNEDNTRQTFKCPKMVTADGSSMQIKYLAEGIYKEIQRIPYLRFEGSITNTDLSATLDKKLDITDLILYGPILEQIDDMNLENLDIHLYVNASDDSNNTLWEEVPQGVYAFNNDLAYGYKWHISSNLPSTDYKYGQYWIEAETYGGRGICLLKKPVSPPELATGRAYRVIVSRRENWNRQFDLNQILTNYVAQHFYNADGTPTTKSVSAEAIDEAIKTSVETKSLKVTESAILGSSTKPVTGTFYFGEYVDAENDSSFKIDGELVSVSENTVISLGNGKVTEKWHNNLAAYSQADFIPLRFLTDHENIASSSTVKVHGIQQGIGNGFDADKLDGLRLGLKRNATIIANTAPDSNNSYIPFVNNDEFSLMHKEIFNAVNGDNTQSIELLNREITKYPLGSIATGSEMYTDEVGYLVDNNTVNGSVYIDSVQSAISSMTGYSFSTVYQFNEALDTNTPWDIAFLKNSPNTIDISNNLATIRANVLGSVTSPSSIVYKNLVAEDFLSTDYSGLFDTVDTEPFDNAITFEEEGLLSALEAIREMPLGLFHYKTDPETYKDNLGFILERLKFVKAHPNYIQPRTLFANAKLSEDSTSYTTYSYTDEERDSIVAYLDLVSDSKERGQSILSSVGLLLKAAKESQDRLLKLETSTFGADAETLPGTKPAITSTGVSSDPTYLGLNRLVQALCNEVFSSTNPTGINNGEFTLTDLSRLDEFEAALKGSALGIELDNSLGVSYTTGVDFNGLNDATNRICNKVDIITEALFGSKVIDDTSNLVGLQAISSNLKSINYDLYLAEIPNETYSVLDNYTDLFYKYSLGYTQGSQTYVGRTINDKTPLVDEDFKGMLPETLDELKTTASTLDYIVNTIGTDILPLWNDTATRKGKNIATRLSAIEEFLDELSTDMENTSSFENYVSTLSKTSTSSINTYNNNLALWSGLSGNGSNTFTVETTEDAMSLDKFRAKFGSVSKGLFTLDSRLKTIETDNTNVWSHMGNWYPKESTTYANATVSLDMGALFKTIYGEDNSEWSVTTSNNKVTGVTISNRTTSISHKESSDETFGGTGNLLENVVKELFKTPGKISSIGSPPYDPTGYADYLNKGYYDVDSVSSYSEADPISNGHLKSFFSDTDPIKAALGTNFDSRYYEDKRLSRFDIIEDSIVAIRKLLGMNNFADATKYTGDVDYAGFNNAESVNYGKIGGASFDPNNSGKSGIFNLIYNNPVTTELKAKQATMEEIIPLQIEDMATMGRLAGLGLRILQAGTASKYSINSILGCTNDYVYTVDNMGCTWKVPIANFTISDVRTLTSGETTITYKAITVPSAWSNADFQGIKINLVKWGNTSTELGIQSASSWS